MNMIIEEAKRFKDKIQNTIDAVDSVLNENKHVEAVSLPKKRLIPMSEEELESNLYKHTER